MNMQIEKHIYHFTGTFEGVEVEIQVTELSSLEGMTFYVNLLSPRKFILDNGLKFPLAMTYFPALDEFHNIKLDRFPELADFISHKITNIHA